MSASTLRPIVRALGGELYDGGRRANIPAPGHSRADRSVSLWLKDGRLIVHTFGDGDWRTVLDHLQSLGLVGGVHLSGPAHARDRGTTASESPSRRARQAVAADLWAAARPVGGTPSEAYLRSRHVTRPVPEALRHAPAAPVAVYRSGGLRRPALVAAIQAADGAMTAVEITYLTPAGRRDVRLRLPRKTVGLAPAGCAVRLDPADGEMLVAEGVCTTLSASARFALPGWALMSTRNLRAWIPPDGVRAVLVAGDRGRDGEASAERLARRLWGRGLRARVALPPAPWGDWNEWAAGR
jgi:putative DNA primase/helicase